MGSFSELVKLIKKIVKDAIEAEAPARLMYGKVTSERPLKINVEQRLELGEAQLILTRNVKNYQTKITMYDLYKNKEDDTELSSVQVTKTIEVKNRLSVGEKVLLLREQGGQRFVVLDRM